MEMQRIETPADYLAALKEVDTLMLAQVGTEEGQRLLYLAKLIEEYEAQHFLIDHPINLTEKK